MTDSTLQVRMLGEFSFTLGNICVNDKSNRSGKIWLLLAYLVCHRECVVPDEALIALLWGEDFTSGNPANALKTVLHRARSLMDELAPGFGSRLIARRRGGYLFAPEIPLTVDAEEFTKLCIAGDNAPDSSIRLSCYERAVRLYSGMFLQKLEQPAQLIERRQHLHKRFLEVVDKTIPLLAQPEQRDRLEALCRHAVAIAPMTEAFYLPLLRALIDNGKQRDAASYFERYRDQLFAQQGRVPGEATSALYREAIRTPYAEQQDLKTIGERLCEKDKTDGAYLCDYDFFKVLYRVQARGIGRSGEVAHIALLTALPAGEQLSRRCLDYCMENLSTLLCRNLRAGDVVARWGAAQYIIMLPCTDRASSEAVMQRIVRIFKREYPHSPARISYTLELLEPYQSLPEASM